MPQSLEHDGLVLCEAAGQHGRTDVGQKLQRDNKRPPFVSSQLQRSRLAAEGSCKAKPRRYHLHVVPGVVHGEQ